MTENTPIKQLLEIGFTLQEARAYLTLLEIGEAKTGQLCNRARIQSSHIYDVLERLTAKGIVTWRLVNNTKWYRANDPATLNTLYLARQQELESQRERMQAVIATLNRIPKSQETASGYKYFEGVNGIKAMWLEMTEQLVPGTRAAFCTATVDSWKEFNQFYIEHHKIRSKKKVFLRMILPKGAMALAKERERIGQFEARFADLTSSPEQALAPSARPLRFASGRGFLVVEQGHVWRGAPRHTALPSPA